MDPKVLIVVSLLGYISASDKWFPVSQKMVWEGIWGSWGNEDMCHQTYATAFKVRVETKFSGDNSALNSVCLICKDGREICSKLGFWGPWYTSRQCEAGFTEGKFRFERNQGSGDDSAGNTLLLNCGGGHNYMAAVGAPNYWGDWSSRSCPYGTRVCGIQTRIEPRQGDGDDSALNGIKLRCCATVVKVEAYLKTIYHGDGGSGDKSYTTIRRTVESGLSTTSQIDNREQFSIATHVGVSVSYGAVSGDASIDTSYLRDTFRSTINTRTEKVTETKEYNIYMNKPTYIYQARSTIRLSDGSTIEQGKTYYFDEEL